MALAPGARIGIYEITAPIGEGGMGAVYRARDTQLSRDVALKVLPDSFSNDPDRVARFTREAQVLASLDHPNIARIYGLERFGANQIIVMELVEGATLEARITHGPLAIDEARHVGIQIADALDAAHGGPFHRVFQRRCTIATPALRRRRFGHYRANTDYPARSLAGLASRRSSRPLRTLDHLVVGEQPSNRRVRSRIGQREDRDRRRRATGGSSERELAVLAG